MPTPLFAINLKLENQLCLVVGGGLVAQRKVESLLECRAKVKVVSPCATSSMQEWAQQELLELCLRYFEPADLDGVFLAVVATDNFEVNCQAAAQCQERGILVNAVDQPEACNFYVPAVVRRGPLTISVSTSGASPLLARRLREELEERYGPEYGVWIETVGRARQEVLAQNLAPEQRRRALESLADPQLLELVRQGDNGRVKEWVTRCTSW